MKRFGILLALLLLSGNALPAYWTIGPNDPIHSLEEEGKFKEAAKLLNERLKDSTAEDRKNIEWEIDRLERIRKDYPLTEEKLFSDLKKAVKGLTREEFKTWVSENWFDSRVIEGKRYFANASVSNLFFRHQDLKTRRLNGKNEEAVEKAYYRSAVEIKAAANKLKQPYVLPKRFHMVMTVTAKPTAARAGEMISAWFPFPREYPFQKDATLLATVPAANRMDSSDSPIRSVFLQQPAQAKGPTEFRIEYDYTTYGVCFNPRPEKVKAIKADDPELARFLAEGPHVAFTPKMRELSQTIVGDETNPCIKAKKIFDWIGSNIQYSFAIEYSTIPNISEYCRNQGYGDCGQEALLLITLCRMNGVPARWQSGWNTFPGAQDIHDWTEIYLAPYGWMPVDPYMGIYSTRYVSSITPAQKTELRDFYFGGLDHYRMIANSDHSQKLRPAKKTMRSDDVDFQRGELETAEHNIYFDQYSYNMDVKEIKPSRLE
jgi:transglutaminase-like putative cysteine protease